MPSPSTTLAARSVAVVAPHDGGDPAIRSRAPPRPAPPSSGRKANRAGACAPMRHPASRPHGPSKAAAARSIANVVSAASTAASGSAPVPTSASRRRSIRPVSSRPARTSGSSSSAVRKATFVPTPCTTVSPSARRSRAMRLGPVRRPGDHLREHRVVVGRDLEAGDDRAVHPHALALRQHDAEHPAACGKESGRRVLGVEPRLHGMAVEPDLAELEPLAGRHPQLLLHEVDAGDELGDRMLHLQPRVHLEEEELVRRIRRHDELDGAGAGVADAPRGLAGGCADPLPGRRVEQRRRRLLDDLLVAALQAALPLAERDDGAVRVGEHLHLDVPRRGHVPLDEERVVAERARRLAPGRGDRGGRILAGASRRACPCRRRPRTASAAQAARSPGSRRAGPRR